ncbi:MAG: YfhO family protein, partial [Oscillospiraceae bacterium]|nr:YfhO family protein [Oscillospiraceae bacterium]
MTFWFCFLAAACFLLPCMVLDKGIFLYAGDFNYQQIAFYRYANNFVKAGGGSWSWETDLGSSFLNGYSFYLTGSPFWWLTLLLPAGVVPYIMAPMLCLKLGLAGGGAYLWMRRYVWNPNMAVVGGVLYALSGFSVYNIFFNHFVDVVALFPYMLWALDEMLHEGRRGLFVPFVALNLLNNYFFFWGQIVFLFIYFFCKLSAGSFRLTKKLFGALAFESLLGCGIGCVLAWPAVLYLMNNPRTVDIANGYDLLMYTSPEQYGAILASFFLPPDIPFYSNIFDGGVIKWTSLTAWVPLAGVAGAVAWCRSKGGAFKRVLCTCLVFAFVPVLNSSFYAFNSSFYARWYYMPTLIISAVTVMALEDRSVDIPKKGIRPVLWCTLAFVPFALVPVLDKKTEAWSLGVVSMQGWFWARMALALGGLVVFGLLCTQKRRGPAFARRLLAAVLAFGCLHGLLHIEVGKFDQWFNDKNFRQQQYVEAPALEWPEEGFWRIDAYGCYDNVGLWAEKSCLQFFNSTVSPSIMEFYPAVDVKRDVSSKPELDKFELRGLLSVKYLLCDQAEYEEMMAEIDEGWEEVSRQGSYVILENRNYIPMGFVYDHYITEEKYEDLPKSIRPMALLKALVLSEEQVEEYGHLLAPLPGAETAGGRNYEKYRETAETRRQSAAHSFEADNWGFSAAITLEKENLVFFSVPYDEGWQATVNGAPAPVLKVDKGLMAIPCPAGEV